MSPDCIFCGIASVVLLEHGLIGVVSFAFRELEAHRIFARVDPDNPASVRVLERVGLRFEGHFARDRLIEGQWRGSRVYALRLEEWSAA